MRAYSLRLLVLAFFVFGAAMLVFGANNDLQCLFVSGTTCPEGSVKLIGVENDTGGFMNAHAQNRTVETYDYSVCCNTTGNSSITIGSGCNQAAVVKLSAEDNAHVEIGSNSNYAVSACLNSSWQRVYCSYVSGDCSASYPCLFSMANSEGSNTSNAHVGNCSAYSEKVCCNLFNNAPTKPTLTSPDNNNITVFDRKTGFIWTQSTDPDGDAVDYTLNVTCGACSASCNNVFNLAGISTLSYVITTTSLCVDIPYNWTVSACDTYDSCNTSDIFNFTIASTIDIILAINSTNFGAMNPNENNDTTDFSPGPLMVYNNGNVKVNVSINASTALFSSVALNTNYYRFETTENESGSLNTGCSQTSYAAMDSSPKVLLCNLSYDDSADAANIHFSLTVPPSEPPGEKSSTIQLSAVYSEQ
jgi:hypothetical protein